MNKLVCISAEPKSNSYQVAQQTSAQLDLELNPADLTKFNFVLNWQETPILVDQEGRKLSIDFINNKQDYQRIPRGKNELLARALGFDKGLRNVLDLSAGMGIDAVFLSRLGFKVKAIERNAVLATLLQYAQGKVTDPLLKEIEFIHADSGHYVEQFQGEPQEWCIYFDPMYPHKTKSALPKQEMILFRNLVGDDQDAALILEKALEKNFARVVVKRPLKSTPLLPGFSYSIESKLVRLDVYLAKKR